MNQWIARPEQQQVIDQVLEKERCCLIGEMGFGKTGCALTIVKEWIKTGICRSVLITTSVKIIKFVWLEEIKRFGLESHPHIHFLSFHKLVRDLKDNPRLLRVYDGIVLDECTLIKNPSADCSKRLTKALLYSDHRLLFLTGTPINKSYLDIYCMFNILSKGEAFDHESFTDFKKRYFHETMFKVEVYTARGRVHPHIVKYKIKKESIPVLEQKIIPWAIYGKSQLILPKLIYKIHHFDLTDRTQATYDWIKKKQPLANISPKGAAIVANRLTQFTSGCVYNDDQNSYTCFHLEKIYQLKRLIDELKSDVIVVYKYKHELELLKEHFPLAQRLSKDSYALWNANQCPILLLQQQADCMGFNLQKGGCHLIWNSLTFSPSFYKQMIARLHRVGKHSVVYCHFLIANNTVDWFMLEQLAQEDSQMTQFNKNVQKYLQSGKY